MTGERKGNARTALEELGVQKGMIFEAIVSTYSPEGQPNAAPMGVTTEDLTHLVLRPYTTTQTYANLKHRRCAVVNFLTDAATFYKTAFKPPEEGPMANAEWFERAEVVAAPRLRKVDALLEVSVVELRDEEPRAHVTCRINRWERGAPRFQPYCRGTFAVIEAIIHATRIQMLLAHGREREAERLKELMEHYQQLTTRVAPDSEYPRIIEVLLARTTFWRKQPDLTESS